LDKELLELIRELSREPLTGDRPWEKQDKDLNKLILQARHIMQRETRGQADATR
jgi:hypothetical protein